MYQKIKLINKYGNDLIQNEKMIVVDDDIRQLESTSNNIVMESLGSMELSRFASSNATLIVSYTNENGDGDGVVFKKELTQPKFISSLENIQEFYTIQIHDELKVIQERFNKGYNKEYGVYLSEEHTTPLDSSCEHCGVSFDGGSIFENFIKQGKMGLSMYKDPKEVLKIIEESYAPPYRFGENVGFFTEDDKLKEFRCLKCNNKTENYGKHS